MDAAVVGDRPYGDASTLLWSDEIVVGESSAMGVVGVAALFLFPPQPKNELIFVDACVLSLVRTARVLAPDGDWSIRGRAELLRCSCVTLVILLRDDSRLLLDGDAGSLRLRA